MPSGLKITNRANHVLFDSTWTAGVEYQDDLFDDEDFQDETTSNTPSDDDSDGDEDPYDPMDANELADILQEQNHRDPLPPVLNTTTTDTEDQEQTPTIKQEPESDTEFDVQSIASHVSDRVKEESNRMPNASSFESEYEDSDRDDVSLHADPNLPTSPNLRRTARVWVPNPRYQNLHATMPTQIHTLSK